MKETWRWFGESDPITLEHVRQTGASGVVTALHQIPDGTAWPAEEIAKRKAMIEAAGLEWSVCESIPMEQSIKRGDADAPKAIARWKDTLVRLGRAGVPVVCYNFMPVVDWTRTNLRWQARNTGLALRFEMVDFVAYDIFILKRVRAAENYDPALVARAEERFAQMSEDDQSLLERNIIAGLPGGALVQTRESIAALIASFDGIDSATMQGNLLAFLREVVPVAEEVGVHLGIHPDDPPFSLFGLPRVVSTPADIRAILSAVESPNNGITLCTGSYGARSDNDLVAMAQEFASRINFAHLRNVTVEADGSFFEDDHLDGGTDMIGVIEALLREERAAAKAGRRTNIPMRPDHGHLLGDDITKKTNPGYSYIGRMKGLGELRGVIRTVERQLRREEGAV
ncbi:MULTISPECIES: mannonate dehydratase [unclassified Rhizobium]|uniref:mannonate dehydratase n=1 Tax=unclassified Rhizobium TaxID=2613769 RepID=UPI00247A4BA6|nr:MULTISPECIES: mannonate dehydratase [unclassified Rhizobium]MDH7803360.1 mannonate dehydratase [Rhizobium sp. AN70]